jgi:hypothetical protein
MIYNPKDVLGLILTGVKNNFSDDNIENTYKNTELLQKIKVHNLDLFKNIDKLTIGESNGNFLNSIDLGIKLIHNYCGKKKYLKRIFLISDLSTKIDLKNSEKILNNLKALDISLTTIGINIKNLDQQSDTFKNLNILKKFEKNFEKVNIFNLSDTLKTLSLFRSKKVIPTT